MNYGDPSLAGMGLHYEDASKPGFTLFSSRNGLLSWSPIVSVALIGVLMLSVRRGAGRALSRRASSSSAP